MTTIYGTKTKLYGDKKSVAGIRPGIVTKILKLPDGSLFGMAGSLITQGLILELYERFIKENPEGLSTRVGCIDFINTLKENNNQEKDKKTLYEFILITKDLQLAFFQDGQVNEMGEGADILSIGSGSDDVEAIHATYKKMFKNLPLPEDVFEIVSSLDNYTSREFDALEL